jgi:alpha-ketoglutarate-dependent taurine dioxygenase
VPVEKEGRTTNAFPSSERRRWRRIAQGMDAVALEVIARAIDDYGVVVLRDQKMTNEQRIAFAENFSPVEIAVTHYRPDNSQRILQRDIVDVSSGTAGARCTAGKRTMSPALGICGA